MKVLYFIMKTLFNNLFSILGWVLFLVMAFVVNNMLKDDQVAKEYIRQLEYVVEADGSDAADCCDACLDYHNIFGD